MGVYHVTYNMMRSWFVYVASTWMRVNAPIRNVRIMDVANHMTVVL